MSTTLAPFGFRAAYHPSGTIRTRQFTVIDATQASYGTAFYAGAPVKLVTDGSMAVGAAGGDILGILDSIEFIDDQGVPRKDGYLKATPTGYTQIVFNVLDDPDMVFEVQVEAQLAATSVGDALTTFSSTYTAATGSTYTHKATTACTAALAGAGTQGLFTVLGLAKYSDNAWADSYPIVQVKIARPQLAAVRVAI